MLSIAENPPLRWPALGPFASAVGDAGNTATTGAHPGRWWVAHTKARCEKAFAFDLLARRIAYFLPMVERVRFSGGRRRHALMPLFPGYVFFRGGREDRYRALITDRLCQVIDVVDQERLARELAHLARALSAAVPLDPYPFAAVGRRCRVAAGPLRGVEGVVVRREGTDRLVLEVAMLGQGAAMEIDAELLEPAEADDGAKPREVVPPEVRHEMRPNLPRLPAGPLVRWA
jgi:transcription antitermination factor NusG